MHKRDRLLAAIHGEKCDRLPVALWRHWPGDDQDATALAAAHLKWQQDYDWDFLKVGPASSYSVVDWGVTDRWVGHIEGTREYTRRVIQKPADWRKLVPLDPAEGMLAEQIKTLSLVKAVIGSDVPIIATVFSPLSQAKHLADNPVMLAHMRQDPDSFQKGLETIVTSTLRFIDKAKEAGVDGIYYAVQHARYPLMNEAEFDRFGRSTDRQVLDGIQDLWLNILHLHSTEVMFGQVADYPVPVLNWHDRETGINLQEGLAQFPGAASGGIDHWSLHQEAPTEAIAEAMDALRQTDGRRLILGTGCVIMTTTPLRNIRALREFVETI